MIKEKNIRNWNQWKQNINILCIYKIYISFVIVIFMCINNIKFKAHDFRWSDMICRWSEH